MDRKILVVDDEVTILMMLREAFEKEGYGVVTAPSGEEALEILKENEFKVMFLDLKLPGIDGLELCKAIRRQFPEAALYAITGHPDKFEFKDCISAGFNGYFSKPFITETLLETAREAFADLEKRDQNHKT